LLQEKSVKKLHPDLYKQKDKEEIGTETVSTWITGTKALPA